MMMDLETESCSFYFCLDACMRRFVFVAAVCRCRDFPSTSNVVLGKGMNDLIYPKVICPSALDSSLQQLIVITSRASSAFRHKKSV